MSIINNKNIYRSVLIGSFILVNILLLLGISQVLEYLNSGADRSTILHLEKTTEDTYLPKVNWVDLINPGRKIEQNTLHKIEKDYLLSWYVKNNAFDSNTTKGIEDFYTQNARQNLYKNIKYNKTNGITIKSTTIKHFPELEFYSEDGQQVVFTDKNVVEFQKIYHNDQLITSIQDTATYKVMMLLEDGFWRVRHLLKMNPEPFKTDTIKAKPVYTTKGNQILKNNQPFILKGINYYPKNSAWDTFGPLFNKDTIAKDFDIIKKANLNTIRIFIQYDDFGKAKIIQEKIDKLKILLDLAEAKKLAVVVTLFDFYSDYTLESWTLTHRHAEQIVSVFKNHNAIIAWDIKNEPNLDFENRDKNNVLSWLEHIITVVKENDPNHLITIGWSNSVEATNLVNKVDIISYHFYNDIKHLEYETNTLVKATKKPVVIEEFGVPSYGGVWNFWEGSDKKQAKYHQKMQNYFKKNNYSFMSWTLYDFPHVPDQVAGKWPWQKNRQKKFGFIDTNGKNKPAFQYISN
ncbi:glycoside hydrolase family 2 TIM barrel-domain containing protein [Flavobacterium sp. K5-23]|uniref:glycoside hydrolase family 2 TIM barrel-domain containing protein n=1 Tax=Flavobacterium sp. K5-23 TaxID=2746225 RepID=UPI00200CBD3B|nr:glycoside hydrolase family 2 TIM barrel-domain containing protein [Flavobacterium sp. K5-23]UQD55853.1 cellulase family glycosylhydrolase [Flavobacterium sp. K5-23]